MFNKKEKESVVGHFHCPVCKEGILEFLKTERFDDSRNDKYLWVCNKCTTIFLRKGYEFNKLFKQ